MNQTKQYCFNAILHPHQGMDACYICFPFSAREEFGTNGRVKIKAWFDGVFYRGSLANMGMGEHVLIVVKEIRSQIEKKAGDQIQVVIEQDLEERKVEVPEDFQLALDANTEAGILFNKLSYSHKKEYVQWILQAKKNETRTNRIARSVEMVLLNKKTPR